MSPPQTKWNNSLELSHQLLGLNTCNNASPQKIKNKWNNVAPPIISEVHPPTPGEIIAISTLYFVKLVPVLVYI